MGRAVACYDILNEKGIDVGTCRSPWLRMDKKPFKILSKVIEELANETTISVDKLVDIYKTFRSLEILRNDDNDKDERWVETEDILNSELVV